MAVSDEKIEKAHCLLAAILANMSPEEQEGFFNKNGNPLYPLPPDEAKIDAFILKFGPQAL